MQPTLLLRERLASLTNQSLRDDAAPHGLLPSGGVPGARNAA